MSSQLHLIRGVGVFTQQIKTTLFQKKKKRWKHTLQNIIMETVLGGMQLST